MLGGKEAVPRITGRQQRRLHVLLQEELERKSENMINTGGRRRQHNMQDLVTTAVCFLWLHLPHTFLFRPFMWIRAEALLGTWDTGI